MLIIQVTDLDEARQATDEGADLIVAQGPRQAGTAPGEGGRRSRSCRPWSIWLRRRRCWRPGGSRTGGGWRPRSRSARAGALIGTRFLATAEALADPDAKKAIVDSGGQETERSSVLDIARGSRWPLEYTGRTLGHPFLDRWRDVEAELAADPGDVRRAYREAIARGEIPAEPVWASQAIGLIRDLPPAASWSASSPRRPRRRWPGGSPLTFRHGGVDRLASRHGRTAGGGGQATVGAGDPDR